MAATICNDVYVNGKMADWALDPIPSKETEKAILIRAYYTREGSACYNREVWIPKSIIKIDQLNLAAHLPGWFVEKNLMPITQ